MSEIDKYYQILGLNPGASEKDIKESYKIMVKVWHPDRFLNDPSMQRIANEKLKEINIAYKKLISDFAGETPGSESHSESQSPPHEPPPKSEKEQYTADDKGHDGFQPPPKQTSGQSLVKSIYAGFWNRFGAVFIDCIIVGIGGSFLSLPFLFAKGMSRATTYPFWMILEFIVSLLIGWLYCTLLESSTKQATIGKMAVGIIVTDLEGSRISFGRANGRWWGKSISFLILGIGYIMAGFTKKKQALHDIMADTLVIKKAEGVRKWVTAIPVILSGIIVLGLIGLIFLELNPLSTEEPDSTITASAPTSSSPPTGGVSSTQSPPETGLSAVDWYNKGGLFLSSGNYIEAIEAYSKTIALNPHLTAAYDGRAFSYYKLGKLQEAIKDLDKVIEARPRDAEAYRIRGNLHFHLGKIPESVKDMKIAAELEPKQPQPQAQFQPPPQVNYQKEAFIPASDYNKRGVDYFNKAEYNKAIDNFTIALSMGINPSYSTYMSRGRAYYETKQYDKAIEDFKQAISLSPNDAKPYGWCGIAFYGREVYFEATKYFTQAIELEPNSAIYYLNRGYAQMKTGGKSLAVSDFKKACDLGDEDACRQLKVLGYR